MVRMLQRAGAVLDDGMVYWDVRPSAKLPDIEVRVADVPATVGRDRAAGHADPRQRDDGARR